HIAKLVGMPRNSRHVGQALKFLSPDATPPVPWQRVLGSSGAISSRGPGTNGAQRQREALEAEGVEVIQTQGGELRVNLREYGWFPDVGTVDTGVENEDEEYAEEGDGEEDEDAELEEGREHGMDEDEAEREAER
ncbi:hypothetical protein CONPUDRAFT_67832, partial [Coniophora puteana RWD-64-598 SS2]